MKVQAGTVAVQVSAYVIWAIVSCSVLNGDLARDCRFILSLLPPSSPSTLSEIISSKASHSPAKNYASMLDSSPVASQSQPIEIPRVLKRSASTASLPTPPRTRHKRRHGRSLHDAEGDSGSGTASEDEEQKHHYKKRRVSQAQEDDDEDAFWTGQPGASSKKASSGDAIRSPSPDEDEDDETSSPVPLLFRKNRQTNSALASPPPSHRKTTSTAPIAAPALVLRSATTASPPETPKGNPVRDSPNNPFLESPLDLAGDAYDDDDDDGANATAAPQELATITYVQ